MEYSTLGLESLALRRINRLTGSTETSSNIQLVWLQIWGEEKGNREGGRGRKRIGGKGKGLNLPLKCPPVFLDGYR